MNIYGWYRKRLTGRRTRLNCRALTSARKGDNHNADTVSVTWRRRTHTGSECLEVEMTRDETEALIGQLRERLAFLEKRDVAGYEPAAPSDAMFPSPDEW